ncbi:uncharacterized protein [Argopecten irradians]|uniref:uncharacterized protein n=1 Tax=Argopecten irradians TaxID=31199 RepID=UPI00371CA735
MTSNAEALSLKEFKGSDQEQIVQKTFRVITTNPAFIPFINLEIYKSNAEDGTSFKDAYITLQATHDCMRRRNNKFLTEIPDCEVVGIRELLDRNILEQFFEDGVDAIDNSSRADNNICQSFLVLLNYLHDIETHEEAIGRLIDTNSSTTTKTQITTALAHHLFSQLVPHRKYEINEFTRNLPETCRCGCNIYICRGDTSLGSQGTWHGRADIMVNNTVAVAVTNKLTMENEENNTDEEKPQSKHRKMETDIKGYKRRGSFLLDPNIMKKILAEAITNGFAQVNKNRSTLANFMIPTFGVTSDYVSICMYDPENDCLLHIDDELELWASRGECHYQLDPVVVIIIWLILNFTVLTKKNLASEANLHKSGLHLQLNESLQYYKDTRVKTKFSLQPPKGRPWKLANKKFKQRTTRS